MKVKCIETKRPNKDIKYNSLTIGKEYIVLSIEFYDSDVSSFSKSIGDFVLYRIEDDDGTIIPYPSIIFLVTSNKMPECWVPYPISIDSYSILPREWARENFWDDFYNDKEDVIEVFESTKRYIYQCPELN